MDLETFQALFSREGQWALESAVAFEPREKDFLPEFQMLSKRFPRELARAALETETLIGDCRLDAGLLGRHGPNNRLD